MTGHHELHVPPTSCILRGDLGWTAVRRAEDSALPKSAFTCLTPKNASSEHPSGLGGAAPVSLPAGSVVSHEFTVCKAQPLRYPG